MLAILITATVDLELLAVFVFNSDVSWNNYFFFLYTGHLRKMNVDVIFVNRVRVIVILFKLHLSALDHVQIIVLW